MYKRLNQGREDGKENCVQGTKRRRSQHEEAAVGRNATKESHTLSRPETQTIEQSANLALAVDQGRPNNIQPGDGTYFAKKAPQAEYDNDRV